MLTFSLLHFLYSRPFFIPYSRCSPGGCIDAWRWSIACLWLMTNWCCIFFYENQWVHIPICFNHLLLQAAVCPAANPPDGNDRGVTVSNLFFTYWHWLNWLPDWEYQTEKRERESHNMEGMIHAWISVMACFFQWPPYLKEPWIWWHVCLCVVGMCAWIMSKMGVCGSSLSRPRQLTDSFMPLCTKMSLSRARWGGRTSQTYIHSLLPQTNVSPFSFN